MAKYGLSIDDGKHWYDRADKLDRTKMMAYKLHTVSGYPVLITKEGKRFAIVNSLNFKNKKTGKVKKSVFYMTIPDTNVYRLSPSGRTTSYDSIIKKKRTANGKYIGKRR